jgi:hypothetical protein
MVAYALHYCGVFLVDVVIAVIFPLTLHLHIKKRSVNFSTELLLKVFKKSQR